MLVNKATETAAYHSKSTATKRANDAANPEVGLGRSIEAATSQTSTIDEPPMRHEDHHATAKRAPIPSHRSIENKGTQKIEKKQDQRSKATVVPRDTEAKDAERRCV